MVICRYIINDALLLSRHNLECGNQKEHLQWLFMNNSIFSLVYIKYQQLFLVFLNDSLSQVPPIKVFGCIFTFLLELYSLNTVLILFILLLYSNIMVVMPISIYLKLALYKNNQHIIQINGTRCLQYQRLTL